MKRIVKSAPPFGRLATVMLAPCASTIRLTIERPRPAPPGRRRSRLQKRSKIRSRLTAACFSWSRTLTVPRSPTRISTSVPLAV